MPTKQTLGKVTNRNLARSKHLLHTLLSNKVCVKIEIHRNIIYGMLDTENSLHIPLSFHFFLIELHT